MREQVRNMDRAMANIESLPGGFNALRQVRAAGGRLRCILCAFQLCLAGACRRTSLCLLQPA